MKTKEKIIFTLGIGAFLFILGFAGVSLYQKFQPDIIVDPNITDEYRQILEQDLLEKNNEIAEDPSNLDTFLYAGLLEQKLGLLSAAERRFKQALKINKRDYLSYMYLGVLYDEMEKFDKANDMLHISTQLEPRDDEPFKALIELYKMHFPGKSDELDSIYRAASDYTKSPDIWSEYAQFLEDRKEPRQAWIYWQEIADADPENEDAKANVERLGTQLGVTE
jgi:tetratricopeptide (TPR) repeat protein